MKKRASYFPGGWSWQASRLFGLLVGVLAFPGTNWSQLIFDNGAPDLTNGMEMTHWIEADQFTLNQATILWQVRFWDAEASASFAGSVFCQIYSDNGTGFPGPVLFSGLVTTVVRSSTGRAVFGAYPEFADDFALPSPVLPAGNYWLLLHNGPLSNNAGKDTFWETATNSSSVPTLSDQAPFSGNWLSNRASSQLAFRLYGAPETARPKIVGVVYNSGGLHISFMTVNGQSYLVEYTDSLTNPNWMALPGAENVSGTGGVVQAIDSSAGSSGVTQRFYRVSLIPVFTTAEQIDAHPPKA